MDQGRQKGKERQPSKPSLFGEEESLGQRSDQFSWQCCQPSPRTPHTLGGSELRPTSLAISEGHPAPRATGGSGKKDAAAQLGSYQQALGQNVLHQLKVVAKLFVLAAGALHLLVCVEAEILGLILELALLQHCKPTDTQAHGQAHRGTFSQQLPTGRHGPEPAPGQVWFGGHSVLLNGIVCQH